MSAVFPTEALARLTVMIGLAMDHETDQRETAIGLRATAVKA